MRKDKDVRQRIWTALRENKTQWLPVHELAGMAASKVIVTRNYLNLLQKAGLVESALQGSLLHKRAVKTWRLLKNISPQAPRLRENGEFAPEPMFEVMWRTVKILRHFSLPELHQHIAMTHEVDERYLYNYLKLLVNSGFVAKHGNQYTLLKNPPTAPKPKALKGLKP